MSDLQRHIDDAIQNILDDREVTRELLDDVMRLLAKNEENHKYAGAVAAKYVETLQRSNEQLVKIAALVQKQNNTSVDLSENDKTEIFDLLQQNSNEEQNN
jgi:hypothetical protein